MTCCSPPHPSAIFPTIPKLITLTGAGGKTSIIYWLASVIKEKSKRVIITTTTKMFMPDSGAVILQHDSSDFFAELNSALKLHTTVTVASRYDHELKKLIGLSQETISTIHQSNITDCILVEGDGAARKPLKAPNDNEPVIPHETEVCIGVMGLDAVYSPLTNVTVHRHELFSKLTGLQKGESITPSDLITLATSQHGLFQYCPPSCQRYVLLNKIDLPEAADTVAEIYSELDLKQSSPTWIACSARKRKAFNISDMHTLLTIVGD
ncbi:selenium cofactor biosynthesis protein YqeC [Halodesulfovibrio marinisediminis]|uniref:Probable selenium-dependent hydroxylase accessory protein YqeC n=1 Tax=Halodesulfovibrio marinisediminis DSM 17456 TaxID=1121457 RepID=A0A1N6DUY5_9BACT|nr:selenium cofactor biosynthesis protein YqeC [Halodesulfovibrio marinisediminis]SIN74560.1 probable selenium-dependent hydroxylase accessory protein YqeC [Halodesulfovibrio marinisediminis DSM 17456]